MNVRKLLLNIHLWTGLILGLPLVLICTSGAVLLFWAPNDPPKISRDITGHSVSLDTLASVARRAAAAPQNATETLILPHNASQAALVQFDSAPGYVGADLPSVVVDPGSGRVVSTYVPSPDWTMLFLSQLHGRLLLPGGRQIVGWLGVAMTLMGISGLYLWWPRGERWANAFIVRRNAKGPRLYRELHSAAGIWIVAMFLVLSITGVAECFPKLERNLVSYATDGKPAPARRPEMVPKLDKYDGETRLDADAVAAIALKELPSKKIWSLVLPGDANTAITVNAADLARTRVYVDPYRATIIPSERSTPDNVREAISRLHYAIGTGPVYWSLALLAGLAPALFLLTGFLMWLGKRRALR